jgi:transmembrane sensor
MFGHKSDEAVRREAHHWSMRMHGDDAATHRKAFEQWRTADPRHEAAYVRLEAQWRQAALLAQTAVGRARALPQCRTVRSRSALGYALAMAVVVLAVGLGFWLRTPGGIQRHAPSAEIASRIGEIRTLRLADGSLVTLDTDSAVRVDYRPGARRVVLTRGRARFDVVHNAERPFVVLAGTGSVTARGTVFDVSLVGGKIGVTLLRGVVDVREDDGTRQPRPSLVRLLPGQHTVYAANEPPATPRIAAPAENSWVSGMLSFDADRLGDALTQANRYSTAKISVADPRLTELKITGAYRVRDATAFATTLAASLGLQVTTERDGNIVLSRPA